MVDQDAQPSSGQAILDTGDETVIHRPQFTGL